MLNPIAALLIEVLEIYKWVVIAAVIVSWLTAFNVINVHNNFVRTLLRILLPRAPIDSVDASRPPGATVAAAMLDTAYQLK